MSEISIPINQQPEYDIYRFKILCNQKITDYNLFIDLITFYDSDTNEIVIPVIKCENYHIDWKYNISIHQIQYVLDKKYGTYNRIDEKIRITLEILYHNNPINNKDFPQIFEFFKSWKKQKEELSETIQKEKDATIKIENDIIIKFLTIIIICFVICIFILASGITFSIYTTYNFYYIVSRLIISGILHLSYLILILNYSEHHKKNDYKTDNNYKWKFFINYIYHKYKLNIVYILIILLISIFGITCSILSFIHEANRKYVILIITIIHFGIERKILSLINEFDNSLENVMTKYKWIRLFIW